MKVWSDIIAAKIILTNMKQQTVLEFKICFQLYVGDIFITLKTFHCSVIINRNKFLNTFHSINL